MTNENFNLRTAFLKGSVWTLLGMGSGQALRFAKNLILTRLLFPEAYGVMSIVWAFLYAIHMLSDAGLEAAAIRHPDGDKEEFLNTVWTAKIIRGVLIFAIACVMAYPVAIAYKSPSLVWLLPLAGFISVLDGISSTNTYTLKRNMKYRRITIIEIINEFLMAGITITWAYLAPGYLPLIGGAVFGATFNMICSHTVLPGIRNKLKWDPLATKDLFHFGKWILVSSAIYLIYAQGDRILLGLHVDPATLGVYSVAVMMSEVVSNVASRLNASVIYPTLVRAHLEGIEKIKTVVSKIRFGFDLALIFPIGVLSMVSVEIINFLYDNRYHAAGGILQILCVRLVITTMLSASENCLIVLGKTKYSFLENLGRAVWLLVGIPLGYHFGGLMGAVWMISLTDIPAAIIIWQGLSSEKLWHPLSDLRSISFAVAGVATGTMFIQLKRFF